MRKSEKVPKFWRRAKVKLSDHMITADIRHQACDQLSLQRRYVKVGQKMRNSTKGIEYILLKLAWQECKEVCHIVRSFGNGQHETSSSKLLWRELYDHMPAKAYRSKHPATRVGNQWGTETTKSSVVGRPLFTSCVLPNSSNPDRRFLGAHS